MTNLTSVVQTKAIDTLSDRYQFISTEKLIGQIEAKGWELNRSSEAKVRKESRQGFQGHLLAFRHPGLAEILPSTNARSIPELIVVNSHDGTKALRMMLGMFRIACLNGLFSGLCFKEFRTSHSLSGLGRIDQGLEFLLDSVGDETARVRELSERDVTPDQVRAYFTAIAQERLKSVKDPIVMLRTPNPKRHQDLAYDAYTILNRGQEMLLRGGIKYRTINEEGITKAGTTRAVYSIPQSIKLNQFAVESMNSLLVG